VRRREFITLLGGAAAWPLAARAQQAERVRRIGVLLPASADDPEFQARIVAFHQGLQQAGWVIGRNVRLDTRWATSSVADIRKHAAELVALAPDVILAYGTASVRPLLELHAPYRLCFRRWSIRSALASSRLWRGQAATPPAS
jgi:putative ABC transport system substrate-binding protein